MNKDKEIMENNQGLNLSKLIITGERRSGTTLIANLLSAQENLTVFRDYLHIERIWELSEADTLQQGLTDSQKVGILKRFNSVDNKKLGIHFEIKIEDFSNLSEFYSIALQAIAGIDSKIVGHKTTVSHRCLPDLLEAIPELTAIYVQRDPRDVVASAVRRFEGESQESHLEFIDSWRRSYRASRELNVTYGAKGRFLVVRYEDLVRKNESCLKSLANFVKVERILIPDSLSDYGRDWRNNSSFGDVKLVLDESPVGRWLKDDPKIGMIVQKALAVEIVESGYKLHDV